MTWRIRTDGWTENRVEQKLFDSGVGQEGRSGKISRSFDLHSSTWRSTIFMRFNPKSCVDEPGR